MKRYFYSFLGKTILELSSRWIAWRPSSLPLLALVPALRLRRPTQPAPLNLAAASRQNALLSRLRLRNFFGEGGRSSAANCAVACCWYGTQRCHLECMNTGLDLSLSESLSLSLFKLLHETGGSNHLVTFQLLC